jgi:hypothetical protein
MGCIDWGASDSPWYQSSVKAQGRPAPSPQGDSSRIEAAITIEWLGDSKPEVGATESSAATEDSKIPFI